MLKIIGVMLAALPSVKMTRQEIEMTAKAWATIFAGERPEALQAAALMAIKTHRVNTLPTPGEIYEAYRSMVMAGQDSPMQAWALVREAMQRFDYRRGVGKLEEKNPAAAEACRAIGERIWWETASICPQNESAMRREFAEEYKRQLERAEVRTLIKALPFGAAGALPAAENPGVTDQSLS